MRTTSFGTGRNPDYFTCCRFPPPGRLFGHHRLPLKDRMRGNSLQLQQERLRVEVRKNFGSVTTVYQARPRPGDVLAFPWNC